MLFHSLDFAVFLPIVFILYWFVTVKSLKLQNFLILIASYVFYAWWDWRFLSLIVFSSLIDFLIGRRLGFEENDRIRKVLLWISVAVNLGFLGFFKYYNFFIENFIDAFSLFGYSIQANTIDIILPVGISFYTFQTMSYTIDVYRRKLKPTQDIVVFGAFVAFFPQLVAGPIERATNLLPQFHKKRIFSYERGADGLRQILWGIFKKVVIADNCADYANLIFNNYEEYNGTTLILGVIFFAFQVYGDFSGYSDIAIGTAKLFGFRLKDNFATPYFSRNIMEFWKRWHISLTSWLTDYIFTPLAINYRHWGTAGIISIIFFTFLVSGLWHGANWTFIAWGALHGVYFLITILFTRGKTPKGIVAKNRRVPDLKEIGQVSLTFLLVCVSYIFFRAESLLHAFKFISRICMADWGLPDFQGRSYALEIIICIVFFAFVEFTQRKYSFPLDLSRIQSRINRHIIYIFLILLIVIYWPSKEQVFVYFQF